MGMDWNCCGWALTPVWPLYGQPLYLSCSWPTTRFCSFPRDIHSDTIQLMLCLLPIMQFRQELDDRSITAEYLPRVEKVNMNVLLGPNVPYL